MTPGSRSSGERTLDDAAEYERRQSKIDFKYNRFMEWLPYATLVFSAGLTQLVTDRGVGFRLTTLAIAAVAALWVFAMYTRRPSKTAIALWGYATLKRGDAHAWRFTLYFFVMIGLCAVLMSRDMFYFIFGITGFFHAGLLRPHRVVVAGIAATSLVVNSSILSGGVTTEGVLIYAIVVVVQIAAISVGFRLNDQMSRLNSEREEAFRTREAALEENAGLHMQLMTQAREAGVLDERQRMAREIHDTVAQGLAGIIAQLHAVDGTDDEAQRRRHLDSALDLARDSLAEARRTVQAIGPPTLDASQLPEALAEVSSKWSASESVPVELVTTGEARPMHPEVEVTLLRIAQEALTNVAKHAEAGRVGITLSYMEDQLAIDVRDDGLGFEPGRTRASGKGGYGLSAMRQRVARLDGRLSIESEPGRGTVVSASVPAIAQAVPDGA
ncbi:sensor histidine kinase [Glycomyces harbinensis]|uniref:Oxygen sensor histidine kinase NreB n=1 Tax=Glycomyces harbinensis TaxID=58114 RepID=A0A1G7C354_9ACTN|nr:sensor histidine kinase [Glycomyces harbinensis]SDE33737.1 Signal transduction histidine kinase [Glycomyces harbinensis]